MKAAILTQILLLSFNAFSSEEKVLGQCRNASTEKKIEITSVQDEKDLLIYLHEEGAEVNAGFMSDAKVKRNDEKKLRITQFNLGLYQSHGTLSINKKTGEGTFDYTDVCWDWGHCGTTITHIDLIECVVK